MATYSIPKDEIEGIRRFLGLSDEQAAKLADIIEQAKPLPPPQFIVEIAKNSGLGKDDALEIVRVLFSLHRLRSTHWEQSLEDFSKEVLESIVASGKVPIVDSQRTFDRITRFLGLDQTLGVVAKASALKLEYDRVFCSSHVFTDLRPVFGNSPASATGALIVHNLNISYHEGKAHREFYVALTSQELDELALTIVRAQEKDKAVKALLKKADLPYLGFEF